jgi:hypothetical protein
MRLGRIAFDILGALPREDMDLSVRTVRPGRTIELVEARAAIGGRDVVAARAWLLAVHESAPVAGGAPGALPPPESLPRRALAGVWPGGYIASLDARTVGAPSAGRSTTWVAAEVALVAGQRTSVLADYVALVDTANGTAVREPPAAWMFPNVDLTIHLHRDPVGRWVGLDTTVVFGPDGRGVTATILHDVEGPVGHAHQLLTVRPMA